MIAVTTALNKICGLKKKYSVIQGGQGSSKTFSILLILIDYAIRSKDKYIVVASAELTKMRETVIKDFVFIMRSTNRFQSDNFKAGVKYNFPNGSTIVFKGLDEDDIGKGLRSDVFFCNEANKCSFESFWQIASRSKRVYIDFNPDRNFWGIEEIATRQDADYIILTHKDNEYLSDEERSEILGYELKAATSNYWANKHRVYGLGLTGVLDGVIFNDYTIIDELPSGLIYDRIGVDFGYSNDPMAAIGIAFKDNTIYLDELCYQTEMRIADLAKLIKAKLSSKPMTRVVCDSARPESINELYLTGINAHRCDKPTIAEGLDALLQYKLMITKRSHNLIKELQQYTWAKDKHGLNIDTPIDLYNHLIDAARYGFWDIYKTIRGTGERRTRAKVPALYGG